MNSSQFVYSKPLTTPTKSPKLRRGTESTMYRCTVLSIYETITEQRGQSVANKYVPSDSEKIVAAGYRYPFPKGFTRRRTSEDERP
jgi:hypothetical protein